LISHFSLHHSIYTEMKAFLCWSLLFLLFSYIIIQWLYFVCSFTDTPIWTHCRYFPERNTA
jgi:hypothetical protein